MATRHLGRHQSKVDFLIPFLVPAKGPWPSFQSRAHREVFVRPLVAGYPLQVLLPSDFARHRRQEYLPHLPQKKPLGFHPTY